MKWIEIRSFNNYISANVLKSRLEAEGIPCFLKDENITMLYGAAFTRIGLQVPEADQYRAQQLLIREEEEAERLSNTAGFFDDDIEQLDPDNRVCVYCGSKNTRRIEDEKDSFVLSWLFNRLKLRYQSRKWHCFHCRKVF